MVFLKKFNVNGKKVLKVTSICLGMLFSCFIGMYLMCLPSAIEATMETVTFTVEVDGVPTDYTMDELEAYVEELVNENDKLTEKIDNYKGAVEYRDGEIEKLQVQLEEKQKELDDRPTVEVEVVKEVEVEKIVEIEKEIKYGEIITLGSGNYVAGDDFPIGKYDIVAVNGRGNVYSTNTINAMMGVGNEHYEEQYRNITFKYGQTLEIKNGVTIELRPINN